MENQDLSISDEDKTATLEAIEQAQSAYKRIEAELKKDEPSLRKLRSYLGLAKTFNTEAEQTLKESIPVRKRAKTEDE